MHTHTRARARTDCRFDSISNDLSLRASILLCRSSIERRLTSLLRCHADNPDGVSSRRCNRPSIIRRRGWISALIVAGNGRHRRDGGRTSARARRITEVTEEDSTIINMPSAGSHKSRVIEFSTSITGRRSARPQEIGQSATYLEWELDDSIPLPKGAAASLRLVLLLCFSPSLSLSFVFLCFAAR